MTCACGYDPMGAYAPEIIMATSQKLIGFEKDGSPVYVDNMSARSAQMYVGNEKDGTPVYVSMATPTNPVNVLGTIAFVAAGAALGWMLTGSVVEYMK